MAHIKDPTTFRHISGIPVSRSSIVNFNNSSTPSTLGLILSLIDSALYVSERRDLFSLINITTQNGDSIGYSSDLPEELTSVTTGLAITFALTPRPLKHLDTGASIRTLGKFIHTKYWGYRTNNEYVTFTLTTRDSGLYDLRGEDLKSFYRLLGAYTKNFISDSSWYEKNSFANPVQDLEKLRRTYMTTNLFVMVKTIPPCNWIYCIDGVRYTSHLFQPEMINPTSLEYLCKYLPEFIDFKAEGYEGISNHSRMHVWLTKGVSDLVRWVSGGSETPEMRSVVYLSRANEGMEDAALLGFDSLKEYYKEAPPLQSNPSDVAYRIMHGHTVESLW